MALQPLPRGAERIPVDEIPVLRLGLIFLRHYCCVRQPFTAIPVQSSEALFERVQARDLSHQCVEVEVRAHFDALCGYHENGLLWDRFAIQPDAGPPLSPKAVPVVGARPPG